MTPLLAGAAAVISTMAGGLFALRYRAYLKYILGFTAGVVLGVVSFDVLPEIFSILQDTYASPTGPMTALIVGFLTFHMVEKLVSAHHSHDAEPSLHTSPKVGVLSAAGLVGHSFLDGVGIGLAYQVNPVVGLAVTIAVVAHDFSDGLNTVSLMLAHGNKMKPTFVMLVLGAVAPIIGVLATYALHFSQYQLTLYLGLFAGFLLYISAGSILPEAHRGKFSAPIYGLTVAGVVFMYCVTRLAE